jgi:hypothetical protein
MAECFQPAQGRSVRLPNMQLLAHIWSQAEQKDTRYCTLIGRLGGSRPRSDADSAILPEPKDVRSNMTRR